MAKNKAYAIHIRVVPGKTSQSVQVVATGRPFKLLMGLVRTKGQLLPLVITSTPKAQALAVLSQAQGLVELLP